MIGTVGRQGGAVVEEGFVVAVPWIGLDGKGIGSVGGALMVSVNYLDVFENIRRVHLGIFGAPDMRHIAPVVLVRS